MPPRIGRSRVLLPCRIAAYDICVWSFLSLSSVICVVVDRTGLSCPPGARRGARPRDRASPSNRKDALQPPTTWPVGCSGPGRSREMWSRERTHQPSTTSPQLSRHRYRGRGGPPACWPSRCGLLRLPWPRPRPCWPLTPKPRACPPRPSESAYGRGGPPGSAGRGHPDERRRIYDAAGIRAGLQTFELRTEPVRASLSVGFLCVGEGTKTNASRSTGPQIARKLPLAA